MNLTVPTTVPTTVPSTVPTMVPDKMPARLRGHRRLISFLAGALAMLLVLEGGARIATSFSGVPVLRWHDYATQLKVEQLESGGTSFDTVIVGTSMAQQGLVPDAFQGRSAYNAGLNGGVPVVMEPWLTDHVLEWVGAGQPQGEAPSTVIWGLSSLDFSATYGDASINAYRDSPSARTGALAVFDQIASERSLFIANRSALRDLSAFSTDERQKTIDQYHDATVSLGAKGERRDFNVSVSPERAEEVRQRISPYALDVDDLAAVVRTIEDLNALGTEVILVELPVPPRFLELYENAESHDTFRQALSALSQELDVRLISDPATFADDDFVDFTHLNEASAYQFSATIDAQIG